MSSFSGAGAQARPASRQLDCECPALIHDSRSAQELAESGALLGETTVHAKSSEVLLELPLSSHDADGPHGKHEPALPASISGQSGWQSQNGAACRLIFACTCLDC